MNLPRKVSLRYSDADKYEDGTLQAVLEGQLNNLPPLSTRLVRVFISSTFSDMIQERNSLMENSYFKLKSYCLEKYRLEFQMIDLRWGLREESQDDHTIIEFCIKEIENCKHLSIGPNFVALLGQKYGYRSFPSTIEAKEFEIMREALLCNGKDITLLSTWYRKDENVLPNVYTLQPISSIIKNYTNTDVELQQKARDDWEKVFAQLQHILRLGVLLCTEQNLISRKEKDKYFISVTEYEILKGMLECSHVKDTSFCLTRYITNLEENINNKRARKFIDLLPDRDIIDKDAQQMLNTLKKTKIKPMYGSKSENMEHFEITWTDLENLDPTENEEYLKRFCEAFEEKIKLLVDKALNNLRNITRNTQVVEIHQHLNMCKNRSQLFRGREDEMKKLKDYLSRPAKYPLILYGLSGSGKTSVLAQCANLIKQWFPQSTPTVIIRFLGTTSHSCSIRLVLYNLCWHICSLCNFDQSNIPGDYTNLVKHFQECISKISYKKSVIIILDSIDQLSQAHKAHNLAWLPKTLHPNVHLILSTLPYEYDLLDNLKVLYEGKSVFIEINQLGTNLSFNLIKEWLKNANRNLTAEQLSIVNESLLKCSFPLYAKLVFEEICRWTSYTIVDSTVLKPTVKGIINKLLDNIEKYNGKVFVKHTLSYLTASKNGLSDVELEDVLSLDDDVLNDVFQHWLPPVRRIPPLLIPRLHDQLSSYLMEREANGIIVYYWYHRQFIFVARERYLNDIGHKLYIHSTLAHYFQGTWGGGKEKPFKCTAQLQKLMSSRRKDVDQADRKVPYQPLWYSSDSNMKSKPSFNLRKLSELPYHLIESKRFIDLHSEVLLNYNWLHSKLTAMNLHDVLSDFRAAIEAGDNSSEISLVFNALRVGGSYVNSNPNTLAFDLLGRLLVYYNDNNLGIRSLLQQCDDKSRSHSALLPLHQCFDPPKAMLLYILEDHSQLVVDLLLTTHELISISNDGNIAFWDMCSGECTRTIATNFNLGQCTKLYVSHDYKYLIIDCDVTNSPVYIYDLKTCQFLYSSGRRLTTQKRGFLVGNILCRQKNFIDVTTNKTIKTLDDFIQSKRYVSCAITPNQRFLLIGDDNESKLYDFETCELKATFAAVNMPSVIVITEDSTMAYVGYMIDCNFFVFDIDLNSVNFGTIIYKFSYKQIPYHKFNDGVSHNCALNEIAISPTDYNMVVLNVKRCNLILYHIKNNFQPCVFDTKVILPSSKTFLSNITFNYNASLLLASDGNNIHIWDIKTRCLLNSIVLHSSSDFPWVVSKTQNIVATASNIHTAINIWDLNKIYYKETTNIVVYEGPVDMIACVPRNRMFIVRKIVATNKSYKYIDSFGLDIWNLSTCSKETFLSFNSYGKLDQIEASPDGQFLAMLVSGKETYIVVYSFKTGKIVFHLPMPNCKSFSISHKWDFISVYCIEDGLDSIYLFNFHDCKEIFKYGKAKGSVFTLDHQFLLYIDSEEEILVYCLTKMAPVRLIPCNPKSLIPVPMKHRLIIVNKTNPNRTSEIWDFHECRIIATINNTSESGIVDVSKNGKYAVDTYLQVYNIENGSLKVIFSDDEVIYTQQREYSFVRLTHDGEYLIWVEDFSVKVGNINKGVIVACTCTHERPMSLELLDHGYIILLGREDGRLLVMKLMEHMDSLKQITASKRAEFLLQCETGSTENLDPLFIYQPYSIKDSDLPKISETLKTFMVQKYKKPHLITATSQTSISSKKHKRANSSSNVGSPEMKDLNKAQFCGSPPGSSSNMTSNPRKIAQSTSSADSVVTENHDSSDENSLSSSPFSYPLNRRSKSLQNILSTKTNGKKLDKSFENLNMSTSTSSPAPSRRQKFNNFILNKLNPHRKKNKGLPPLYNNLSSHNSSMDATDDVKDIITSV